MLSLSVLTARFALQQSYDGINMKPLKWQNQIRLTVGLAFVSLIGLLYAASSTILINSLKKAEEQDGLQIVKGVLGVFERTQEEFSQRYIDWSTWDDSYQFIQDGNQKYIDSSKIACWGRLNSRSCRRCFCNPLFVSCTKFTNDIFFEFFFSSFATAFCDAVRESHPCSGKVLIIDCNVVYLSLRLR